MASEKKSEIRFKCSPHWKEKVDNFLVLAGTTYSELARDAIDSYIDEHTEKVLNRAEGAQKMSEAVKRINDIKSGETE